jgi:dihydroorotase
MTYDLVLTNGRVIDPSQGVDRVTDVAFADGKVAAVGEGFEARDSRDVTGLIVTPGLIDLHTHVYWGGTSLGVDADQLARSSAVTTFVDAGSAGPGNFLGFRKHVIERSEARILAYLHVSFAGIFGFAKTVSVGESHDIRLIAAAEAAEVAAANRDLIVGIKVRIGRGASGPSGIAPLFAALDAAEATGLPVMVHVDEPPPSYEQVVSALRPGDILTHCFRPFPNAPVLIDESVKPAILAARERGVLFDIGHGKGSFGWKSARAMVAAGFMPDTISSDVHAFSIDGPAFDQITTLSKFLALGMPLADVIRASTARPAEILKRPDLGTFKPGSAGDASVLDLRRGSFALEDVKGEVVTADERLIAAGTVIGGRWWHPA